ncbi:ATP-dependent helicase [Clostridium sp. CTA-1]
MRETFYKKLEQIKQDPLQLEAYKANDSTVVLAGPGSGKTTILTLKVMRLLSEKIQEPRGIACVTYSREAAREFKERLSKLGIPNRKNIFLGTVHSFCLKEVIEPFVKLYPMYNIPYPVKLVSEKKKNIIFSKLTKVKGIDINISKMDRERTREIEGLSQINTEPNEIALEIADEYEKELENERMMDFISIVKYATKLIQNEDYVRICLEAKFPWIIIDEYQDLGKPLHEMILSLITNTKMKYFAVGDPDQSIYDFQGASPEYLIELGSFFSVRTIKLINNYRSAQKIINASEIVLGQNRSYISNGPLKNFTAKIELKTCEREILDQCKEIVKRIKEDHGKGMPYHEMAILCGNKYQISDVCNFLQESKIDFYISKHLFDISDIVKWLQKCAGWVVKENISFDEIFMFWEELNRNIKLLIDEKIIKLKRELYNLLLESKKYCESLPQWLNFIIDELRINQILDKLDICPDENQNLQKLKSSLNVLPYKEYTLFDFYSMTKPKNQVIVSTRHGAKGLEFDAIYMIGMEEGNFPYYNCNKIEEEESYRICFVCVSRARKKCVLLYSKIITLKTRNGLWEKHCAPNRFWKMLSSTL